MAQQEDRLSIALNATAMLSPLTGIGRYTAELAAALTRMGVHIDYYSGTRWSEQPPQIEQIRSGRLIRRLINHLPGARLAARHVQQHHFNRGVEQRRPALYHEPNYLAFRFAGPTVVTAHDASWVRYPEMHPAERVRSMNHLFPAALANAQRVIVDSDFVAGEMHEVFGVPLDRLRTVYLGVSPLFRPLAAADTADMCRRHGIEHGRYILAVGTLEPRKNLISLIRAFRALPPQLARHYPLVIAGMRGWRHGDTDQEIGALEKSGALRILGHVAEADLPALYAGAGLFVYPSIYEGFGLPPLEAMAAGVPVVVADCASLPEVVGDAGIRVAPYDIDALAETLRAILENPAQRQAMSAASLARSQRFTWENCARETFAVYREAIAAASNPNPL